MVEDVKQFRGATVSSPTGEQRQKNIPYKERKPKFKARSVLHVELAAVYDDHVGADVVKTHHPILFHPSSFFQSIKVLLKFEDIGIIRHGDRLHGGCFLTDAHLVNSDTQTDTRHAQAPGRRRMKGWEVVWKGDSVVF